MTSKNDLRGRRNRGGKARPRSTRDDAQRRAAEDNLELIRTLMERATRYEHLSARTGLQVGCIGIAGALVAARLGPENQQSFLATWAMVFVASVCATTVEQMREVRHAGVAFWTRPARQIVTALMPALGMAIILTVHSVAHGRYLELPGVWMLCYGCGALATATFAPPVMATMGTAFLVAGGITLTLGPVWANTLMGLVFGGGHLLLAVGLMRRHRLEEPPHLTLC